MEKKIDHLKNSRLFNKNPTYLKKSDRGRAFEIRYFLQMQLFYS